MIRLLPRCLVLLGLLGLAAAADLADELARAMTGVGAGGEAGVAVYDLEGRTWLYRHQADTQRTLASTTKMLVAAAALVELGPRFRFLTHLHALGPVRDGVAPGLGVVGGGDPCLDGHFFDDDPDQPFVAWAAKLKSLGITRIDGDLVIDGRLFSGPIRPATYPQDFKNLVSWYSAPASAFAWNDNCLSVRAVPARSGEPAEVQVRPRSPRIAVDNRTRTVAGRGDRDLRVNRAEATNDLTVGGNFGQATRWYDLAIHDDPDLLAGDHLRHVLQREGLAITGQVRRGAVEAAAAPLLVEHASPLIPALGLMNRNSQNFYGEQILRILGVARHREGTIEAGARATRCLLYTSDAADDM
jgi:D-alanyl-D-alanine carboxypeptidase/D-alanyl-D-alanine-endopeptidase (penicillin-binding protein 4)